MKERKFYEKIKLANNHIRLDGVLNSFECHGR